jgi:2-dehydropantoate 2-reductase
MRLLIWGAGAIGGTLGAWLGRAGHDITLVDSSEDHVAAINRSGLRITGPIDEFTVLLPAFTSGQIQGEFSHVVLATKAQHTAEAAAAILPHLPGDGYVVSAQNGLNELVLTRILGAERTIGAFVNFGADYLEPGLIHYGGRGVLKVGELDGQITDRILALQRVLADFDPGASITSNIWGYLWGKEAYGAMLFATALTSESIADALAEPVYRPLYVALAREVLAVAAAQGVVPERFDGFEPQAFGPSAPHEASALCLDELVAFNHRSAKTHSGIWRDLAVRKRQTEVDAQLGIIVELGAAHGVRTPLLGRLVALIHDVEEGRRPLAPETLDELRSVMKEGDHE